MYMSENVEKKPDEKPSPEQQCKAARGKKAPLFTGETRSIIWGLQARAVQVYLLIVKLEGDIPPLHKRLPHPKWKGDPELNKKRNLGPSCTEGPSKKG